MVATELNASTSAAEISARKDAAFKEFKEKFGQGRDWFGFVTISTEDGLARARQNGYGKHYLSREEAIEHQVELHNDPMYPVRVEVDFDNVFDFIHGTVGPGKEAAIKEVGDVELGTVWATWPKYDAATGEYIKQ